MVSKSPTVTSHSWVPSMPSWSIRLIDSVAPACVWRSRIHVDASPGTMSYTLLFSGAFLATTWAGHGTPGALLSGGSIPLLNVATGLEVAGALAVILGEFLEQHMLATEEPDA